MVSHQGFRTIGYVYAILGILSSIFQAIKTSATLKSEQVKAPADYALMPGSLIALAFFAILLVGISKRNLTLVKIYRVYLKVSNIIVIVCITVGIVFFIGLMIFSDIENSGSGLGVIIVFILLIALAIVIGYYFLALWIVNGVIAAIQSEQGTNGAKHYKSGANNNPQVAPV